MLLENMKVSKEVNMVYGKGIRESPYTKWFGYAKILQVWLV